MKITLTTEIIRLQKEYKKSNNKLFKAEAAFDCTMEKAGCLFCPIFEQKYSDVLLEERFYDCGNCKYGQKVKKALSEYLAVFSENDLLLMAYAKAVFEILVKIKPKLYHNIEKKTYRWDQVFPAVFELVDENMYESIVKLVDPGTVCLYSIN